MLSPFIEGLYTMKLSLYRCFKTTPRGFRDGKLLHQIQMKTLVVNGLVIEKKTTYNPGLVHNVHGFLKPEV